MNDKANYVGTWSHEAIATPQQFEIFLDENEVSQKQKIDLLPVYAMSAIKLLGLNFFGEIKDSLGNAVVIGNLKKDQLIFVKMYDKEATNRNKPFNKRGASNPILYEFIGDLSSDKEIYGTYSYIHNDNLIGLVRVTSPNSHKCTIKKVS